MYRPLSGTRIRLIELEPGSFHEPIRCQLRHVDLGDNPRYCALSYVWGGRDQMKNIEVNGRPFPVTLNLYDALWRFRQIQMEEFAWREELLAVRRYTNRPIGFWKWEQNALDRRESGPSDYPMEATFSGYIYCQPIWVDAICINQQNIDEKNRQIPLMRSIYSLASTTVAWLGKPASLDEEIHIGMMADAAEELYSLSEVLGEDAIDRLAPNNYGRTYLDTAYYLLHITLTRPWFTRIWIVQEVVLSTRTILMIGDRLASLEGLYCLLCAFTSKENFWALPPMTCLGLSHGCLNNLVKIALRYGPRASCSQEIVKPTLNSFAHDLYSVLQMAILNKEATDQRDMIYGVLGMTRLPELPKYLVPDYETPYEIVFWRYFRFLIERTGDLRCLQWKTEMLPNVPTWVPNLKSVIPNLETSRSTVFFSPDGRCMTVEGSRIGSCVKTVSFKDYDYEDPKECGRAFHDFHREILRPWSELKKLSLDQVITQWLDCFIKFDLTCTFSSQSVKTYYKLLSHRHGQLLLSPVSRYFQSAREVSYLRAIGETLTRQICENSFFLVENGIVGSILVRKRLGVCNGDVLCFLKGCNQPCILQPVAGSFMFIRTCRVLSQGFKDANYENWRTNRPTEYLTLI
ncbi:heterokaryon incompatibility protein-domain-containing protein [Hypoxylon sp. FL0543]|nr:heterokaryon incompatibility protein-domain-containing protein [Hypoxylon sp. FL0543]